MATIMACRLRLGENRLSIHDDLIICAYVTTPFDKLRVTGHGEPVEPCAEYSLGNDSHAQLFMTLYIILKPEKHMLKEVT